MHTTQRPEPPPGIGGGEGGDLPIDRPRDPLAAIDHIAARTAALANARIAAQNWANVSGTDKYVIEHGAHVFIADDQDVATYHQADLDTERSVVAWTATPAPPLVAAPDVAFAPVGWDAS